MSVMFTARPASAQRRIRLAVAVVVFFTIWHTVGAMFGAIAEPPGSDAADNVVPGRIVVGFNPDAPGQARAAARSEAGGRQVLDIPALRAEAWEVRPEQAQRALDGLRRNPHVAYAEMDVVVELDGTAALEPNDPEFYRQWGPRQVNAPAAWAVATSTKSATIAILDTGVAVDHPDLKNKLLPGRNTINGTSDVTDTHSHGTASAGVAGADTDNGLDVAGYGWNASILPVKVIDGHGGGSMSALAAGIVWATDNGADIISMSLGATSGTTTVRDAVRYAYGRDVVLVASAGNDGSDTTRYPAAYAEVISVAGTDNTDSLYHWSNYGSGVDVAAPGQNRTTRLAGGSILYAGTSSAAPAVAGVLALGVPYASGAQLRAALEASSTPLSFVKYGRIDAHAMLVALGADASSPAPEPGPEPVGPTADFTSSCDLLACAFADGSDRGDATITAWQWRFGDGTSASGVQVSHTYEAAGSYTVRLTVTDADGLSHTTEQVVEVTVPDPERESTTAPAAAIDLAASGSKTRGLVSAHLTWTGSGGSQVDLYVNGRLHTTVQDVGTYRHQVGARGNPTVTYQVCDAGDLEVCSDEVTVDSW